MRSIKVIAPANEGRVIMLMPGLLVVVVMLALLIWDLLGQPTGRRWRRRRKRRADAAPYRRKD